MIVRRTGPNTAGELRALPQRAGFNRITVQTDHRLKLALAPKGQP